MTELNQNEIIGRIQKLKKEKNAVILVHNYQLGEVQDIGDYVGDSLGLSIQAKEAECDVIVFCGVRFMAETAKILSPDKTVLLPVAEAGCPMADMATADQLRKFKKEHPGVVAVAYVNSTAELKTEVDICCTSANAEKVVASIPKDKEIIFLPDKNLGANVARDLGRELMLWPGFCPTHMRISKKMINQRKEEFPDALVMVHPECEPEVVEMADVSLSTGGMLKFAAETDAKQIIVGTELGIIHRLKIETPDKIFIPVSEQAICPNMKLIELHDVLNALENMETEIILEAEIIEKARASIEKMIAIS
ncbi:MAG: quinolinate synthase NadA [Victivallales bacterium]|nr:quinolinate synthase NadA [Victivallales bacterium]